jgi:hypothetical protein
MTELEQVVGLPTEIRDLLAPAADTTAPPETTPGRVAVDGD